MTFYSSTTTYGSGTTFGNPNMHVMPITSHTQAPGMPMKKKNERYSFEDGNVTFWVGLQFE
jgi:hypothetical protein